MGRKKKNPEIDFDLDELSGFLRRLRKVRPKSKVTDEMVKHVHQIMRWWAIDGKNIKRYEHLYYTDKSYFVRDKIIQKTKNIKILSYASLNDKERAIRDGAMRRLCHFA